MRRHPACVFYIPLLSVCACKSEAPQPEKPPEILAPLPLDEPLGEGRARAGLISKPEELLTGVTAKGRLGDYKLYNSKIAVVIGKPGFARGYQPFGGTIVDADRVRAPGEEGHSTFGEIINAFDLSVLEPESISVVSDGRDGGPAIVRVSGRPADLPLFKTLLSIIANRERKALTIDLDYVLAPDSDALELRYTLFNAGDLDDEIGLPLSGLMFGDGAQPFIQTYGFASPEPGSRSEYYGAVAPDVSYFFGRKGTPIAFVLSQSGINLGGFGDSFKIRARERITIGYTLLVGDGDLSRTQAMWRKEMGQDPLPELRGRVLSASGEPVAGARVHVTVPNPAHEGRDYETMTRTGLDGTFRLEASAGEHIVTVATDAQIISEPKRVMMGETSELDVRLPAPGRLSYRLTDENGQLLPAKLTIVPESPNIARVPSRFGEALQPGGTLRAEFGINGQGLVSLPAGDYSVYASRGSEYEVVRRSVHVDSDMESHVQARLTRSVDTKGWMSTDTHIHSQLSPDSPDLFPFKVSAMVVEGLELPISTEHESIGDFNPAIRQLQLEPWIKGVIGSEITTMVYGHFNAFPLVPDPEKPGNGRIDWYEKSPAETFAAIHANPGRPFLQVNHPRSAAFGGYFSAMGFDRDRFAARRASEFSMDFEGIEVANGCGVRGIEANEMPDWFSFLNKGVKKLALGSTDNHHAGHGGMGYAKTYVRMPTDDPSAATIEDFRAAFFAGRAVVSCGPFLEMRIGTGEIGDMVKISGEVLEVEARAAGPSWMDLDQIELIVNGEVREIVQLQPRSGDRFHGTIRTSIPAGRDGWAIVRVRGSDPQGIWAFGEMPWAFTNPIYFDANDDGRWTME
jgi:hypothetical protein